ncbi:NAD(P)H-hydrate dehydratase [Tautonia plasticadhaerens]|uniref:ADP-dependent (S)-NAD(P)H-hydrate dehydratase n=1 Tax=Tautonia plasticadhaerens TaxID=2527974 RepID=A0A518HAU3_9BACT|nr:NAD(P)H-hydrate dehydratase [Tautonia plasticadhaerens]QDV37974.1 ATP-dependent (S)-NAD(P)H-hydrate dehydratase [Tautonia plasticadhaerens]
MSIERFETIPGLEKRPADSHKGMYGHVLVLAGGRGMAGAAGLVGASALRSGAGLVRVACPGEVAPVVATFEPSYMTYPLPQDGDGLIDYPASAPTLDRLIGPADVLAVGPGLGQSRGLSAMVRWLVEGISTPAVLDADALNALAATPEILRSSRRPIVITPHPGEFSRLTGDPVAEIQADREAKAAAFAGRSEHLTVVLKGRGTIVTDGRRLFVNNTGNPGMATGGAGDVLTGVIAALIGQGLPAFEAAVLGVHAHGLAGDIARQHSGEVGLIAGDVVDGLADAFEALGSLG